MGNKKPTLNLEGLEADRIRDNTEDFLDALHFRTLTLLKELETGKFNKELVAFETLLSAFSFLDEGLSHADILSAYPIESWRQDTVEVPKALVRSLLEAWVTYKTAPDGVSFGEAFGMEGGDQGKAPLRKHLSKLNRQKHYSNSVLVEYLAGQLGGQRLSWEEAIGIVADREGVSESTIKRASEEMRTETIEIMTARGWIEY